MEISKIHISLILLILFFNGCKVIEQKKTTLFVVGVEELKKMSPQELVGKMKKFNNDIFVIDTIPSKFCDSIFVEELSRYVGDFSKSANIQSSHNSSIPRYKNLTLSKELDMFISRIHLECDSIVEIDSLFKNIKIRAK